MTTETRSAFASRMGVNKSTVTRWAQAGRLVVDEAGLVKVAESQARITATMGHRGDVAERHAKTRGAEVSAPQAAEKNAAAGVYGNTVGDAADGLPAGGGRARYQALTMQFENQSIKLEMALRRGLRFPREAVKHEAQGLGSMLRAALERMIDIAAPQLAAEKSEGARRRLITNELEKVKRSIKREFPAALRRMRPEHMRKAA